MLYICATPIGNLEDITLRALRILSEADAIYAEDTRQSLKLLNHYEIKKPLISCHEHNEAARAEEIAKRLEANETIVYVSDAGTPLISDPGVRIVSECVKRGLEFTVLPGASAATTALILSGLSDEGFLFMGFLPRSGAKRRERMDELRTLKYPAIIYESPNRVHKTLSELRELLGDNRGCAVVREMTKLHEEAVRGTLFSLTQRYDEAPPKGECVIVIAPAEAASAQPPDYDAIRDAIDAMRDESMKPRDIAREISRRFLIPANEAYDLIVNGD